MRINQVGKALSNPERTPLLFGNVSSSVVFQDHRADKAHEFAHLVRSSLLPLRVLCRHPIRHDWHRWWVIHDTYPHCSIRHPLGDSDWRQPRLPIYYPGWAGRSRGAGRVAGVRGHARAAPAGLAHATLPSSSKPCAMWCLPFMLTHQLAMVRPVSSPRRVQAPSHSRS